MRRDEDDITFEIVYDASEGTVITASIAVAAGSIERMGEISENGRTLVLAPDPFAPFPAARGFYRRSPLQDGLARAEIGRRNGPRRKWPPDICLRTAATG